MPVVRRTLALVALAGLFIPTSARAHRDDYIDETFVYQTIERHELELELWADARLDRARHWDGLYTAAFEYGVTERWMLDAATQWADELGRFGLERVRAETRLRFADEGDWPIDVAASLEYELEHEPGGYQHTVTPRLVLSRDLFRELNTTLNLDVPISLGASPEVAFAYAIGVRYPGEGLVRVGAEFRHEPLDGQARLFPQIWFDLPYELTLKLGVGVALTRSDTPVIARAAFEIGL